MVVLSRRDRLPTSLFRDRLARLHGESICLARREAVRVGRVYDTGQPLCRLRNALVYAT